MPAHETYAYSASKAGLHHLSRNFAGRLGFEGITSNTLACGPFQSKSPSLPPILVSRLSLSSFDTDGGCAMCGSDGADADDPNEQSNG